MSKTSSSYVQVQTAPLQQQQQHKDHHSTSPASAGQSPAPATGDDQKARGNEGSKCRSSSDRRKRGAEPNNNPGLERKNMCIIDVRNNDNEEEERESVSSEGERVCRICQLSSDHLPAGAKGLNLVPLGCACRGELGVSHYRCAEAWFLQKGNRTCEICGRPAKNIEGIEDTGFRPMRTEISVLSSTGIPMSLSSYHEQTNSSRCGKSLCNFLLAALVLAFLLPWIFHPTKLL